MTVLQIQGEGRRGPGRPRLRSDEETLGLIITAARAAFQTTGYAGTCIGDVAQAAGVSTKTLYRLVPTKAELLRMVVSDRIGRFMLTVDEAVAGAHDLADAIERILIAYGQLTLAADVIAMNRLVLAEGDRFPEIATAFYEAAIKRTSLALGDWLRQQCERGLIALEDPFLAAGMLRGMMVMEPQRAVMLGQRPAPDSAEITRRARKCARLFLDGCRTAATAS
jgi:AcrR family transcriptional regulator